MNSKKVIIDAVKKYEGKLENGDWFLVNPQREIIFVSKDLESAEIESKRYPYMSVLLSEYPIDLTYASYDSFALVWFHHYFDKEGT